MENVAIFSHRSRRQLSRKNRQADRKSQRTDLQGYWGNQPASSEKSWRKMRKARVSVKETKRQTRASKISRVRQPDSCLSYDEPRPQT